MRKMKDSGIKYLGTIPKEWSCTKIKYSVSEPVTCGVGEEAQDYSENSIRYIRISDFDKNGNIDDAKAAYIPYVKSNGCIINKGDILAATAGGTVGKTLLFQGLNEEACYAGYLAKIRTDEKNMHNRYLLYQLRCDIMIDFREYAVKKSTIENISASTYGNMAVVLPPYQNQICISNYLDEQCKKIDEIMADIQNQIDTLEDYKKSVISEAVTRGLDPDAVMKNSGVSHIDSIPSHWKTIKLKYASTLKGRIGWQGLRTEEYRDDGPYLVTGTDFNKGYINWSSCVHVSKERFEQDKNIQVQENDLLITKDGTIGKIAMAKECPTEVSLNSGVFIVRNNHKYRYIDKFFYYIILSKQFSLWFELAQRGNSTIKHLTQEKFYEFTFAYPPIEEQARIANFLDDKCGRVDSIIENKKTQLETIENYKKSLIYEYVTGKRKVPENE